MLSIDSLNYASDEQIFQWLEEGKTSKEIAKILDVHFNTIEIRIRKISVSANELVKTNNAKCKKSKGETGTSSLYWTKDAVLVEYFNQGMSPSDMAKIIGCTGRAVQIRLKKLGLVRDAFEAQQLASKKRDYADIRKKSQATMQSNGAFYTNSSGIEQYCRLKLTNYLTVQLSNEFNIIVGCNGRGIFDKEIDIPIIAINKNNNNITYIAVEVDGSLWHTNNHRDIIKEKHLNDNGCHIIRILTDGCLNKDLKIKGDAEIDNKIDDVVKQIINILSTS